MEIKALVWTSQWSQAKADPKKAQDIFLLLWWPTYSDPYETLFSLLHDEGDKPAWNLAYYKNPAYDKLIRQAYETTGTDPEKALKPLRRGPEPDPGRRPGSLAGGHRRQLARQQAAQGAYHQPGVSQCSLLL